MSAAPCWIAAWGSLAPDQPVSDPEAGPASIIEPDSDAAWCCASRRGLPLRPAAPGRPRIDKFWSGITSKQARERTKHHRSGVGLLAISGHFKEMARLRMRAAKEN